MLGQRLTARAVPNASILVSLWRMVASSIVKQPTLRRPFFLVVSGLTLSFLSPSISEGGEAPKGAGAERRTPWPVSRSGRSLQRKGSPASNVGRRASRRSTAAFAETTKRRLISSGPRFLARGHLRPDPVQQSSLRKGRSAQRAEPRNRPSAQGQRRLAPAGAAPAGSCRGLAEFLRLTSTKGKVLCRISGPSPRFVPPWLASRKRPSTDEVRRI